VKPRMVVLAGICLTYLAATVLGVEGTRPLQVVPSVDYARFAGQWYEIARLPNAFQQACAGNVTARYVSRPDGILTVINLCREANGRWREVRGVARRTRDQGPNSRLQVRFAPSFSSFLPFVWGDYQLIAVADDYRYALVGTPDRQSLWVLSRVPQMDEASYQHLVAKAHEQGFAVTRLQQTSQSGS
jgi:apolipoprotein D and lipocalin family protein